MKLTITLSITIATLSLAVIGCNEKQAVAHDHDGDGKPDHGPEAHNTHHDHDHAGHDHSEKTAGPNGGRIITSVEPHAEFLVTEDSRIRITFLDDENNAIAPAGQSVEIVCGDRSKPTVLSFSVEANSNSLLSSGIIPPGDKYPMIITIKTTPEAAPVRERFTLDLSDCPTCEYREYACTCDHDDHDDHDHDHEDHDHDHEDHDHDH